MTHAGHWHGLYARPEQPLHLELGCGKGGFLGQLAPLHPDINYLGIDITDKVLILAKRKVEAAYAAAQLPPDNVKIASLDIERLSGVFSRRIPCSASTSTSATRGAKTLAATSTA